MFPMRECKRHRVFPRTSGRQPKGSRTAINSCSLMIKSENAPSISAQRAEDAAAVIGRPRQQMQNDFAVGGGLENGTFAFQFVAQAGRR